MSVHSGEACIYVGKTVFSLLLWQLTGIVVANDFKPIGQESLHPETGMFRNVADFCLFSWSDDLCLRYDCLYCLVKQNVRRNCSDSQTTKTYVPERLVHIRTHIFSLARFLFLFWYFVFKVDQCLMHSSVQGDESFCEITHFCLFLINSYICFCLLQKEKQLRTCELKTNFWTFTSSVEIMIFLFP